jgi:hypothetical protein
MNIILENIALSTSLLGGGGVIGWFRINLNDNKRL